MYKKAPMKKFFRLFFPGLYLFAVFSGCLYARPQAETEAPVEIGAAIEAPVPEPPAAQPLVFTAAESVVQGDIFCVLIQSPQTNRIKGVLADLSGGDGKKILSMTGFPVPPRATTPAADNADPADPAPETGETWAVLGGISSVQRSGDYTLNLRASCEGEEDTVFSTPIAIRGRSFISENIPLNEDMSSLRADPDPRKAAESRELWALLVKTDTSSVYHLDSLSLPVNGNFRETSFFGDRRTFLYTDGGKANSIHYGLDYATPRGTPVYASGAGKIVMAKQRVLTGFSIVIEHLPGVYTLYYHLDKIDVKLEQLVKTGDKIGESGFTGLATGPHLHWEVRVAANAVEPKNLLTLPLLPGAH